MKEEIERTSIASASTLRSKTYSMIDMLMRVAVRVIDGVDRIGRSNAREG
jgi:hypothetical protein